MIDYAVPILLTERQIASQEFHLPVEETATVFVVDDDAAVRKLIIALLESTPYPVKTFDSAVSFLDYYQPMMPGCLISDVMMPRINGLELQKILSSRGAGIPILFISGFGNISIAREALKQGAVDFFEKPFDARELLVGIESALTMDRLIRKKEASEALVARCMATLTEREEQILGLLLAGNNNKEVESKLSISRRTVESHRANIIAKFGCSTFTELVCELLESRSMD